MFRGGGGGRCCDQVPCPCSGGGGGREVLRPGPMSMFRGGGGREGGAVTRSHVHVPGGGEGGREGGRCCDQVPCSGPGGGEGGVVTRSHVQVRGGGRVVLWQGPWFTPPSPPPGLGQTNACENITFARFATRAVINVGPIHLLQLVIKKSGIQRRFEVEIQ